MKKKVIALIIIVGICIAIVPIYFFMTQQSSLNSNENVFVTNHNHSHLDDLKRIPEEWIEKAKADLHIMYWHTSHGSQLLEGMTYLDDFMNTTDLYAFNNGGTGGALDIDEASADVSNNLDALLDMTRAYLDNPANREVNVVMWAWCYMETSFEHVDNYLSNMSQLELEYSNVSFVYTTGPLDGLGEDGPVNLACERIREYCEKYDKILYDFADIESYDPDDNYFLDLGAEDTCDYDGGNWALEWQATHTEGVHWYDCDPAHTKAVNGNMKAYGAWNLFAKLAGWSGP